MPYSITLTNGNVYAAVADGTINTDSNMILIGKDFAGYGQFIDQNIIRLLESSAAPYRPTNKVLEGQLWYDQTNSALKVAYRAGVGNTAGWTTASPARFLATTGAITNLANIPPSNAAPGDLWYCLGYAEGNLALDNLAVIRMNANVTSTDLDISWPVVGPHNLLSNTTIGNLNANGIRSRYLDVTFFANINNANILTAQSTGHIAMANANISTGLEIAGILDLNANRGTSNAWIPNLIGSTLRVDGVSQFEEGNVTSYKFLARPPWGNGNVMAGFGTIPTNWNTTGNVPGNGNGAGFFGNSFGQYVYGSEIGNALVSDFIINTPGIGNQSVTGGASGPNNQLTTFHGWLANDNWSWRQPFIRSIGANMNVASSTTGYHMNTAIWTDSKSSNVRTANVAWEGWSWGNVNAAGYVVSGNLMGNIDYSPNAEAFSFVTDVIDQFGNITGNFRVNTLSNVGYYGPNTWVVANAFVGNLYGAIKGAITKPIEANTTTIFAGNLAANTIAFPVGGNVIQDPADLPADIRQYVSNTANISIYAPKYGSSNNYSFFDIVYANSVVIWDGNLEVRGQANGDANGNAVSTFFGNVEVRGDLKVRGNLTSISTQDVLINGTELILGNNASSLGDLNNAGFIIGNAQLLSPATPPSIYYNSMNDRLQINRGIQVDGDIRSNGSVIINPGSSFQGQLGTSSIRSDAYVNDLSVGGNASQIGYPTPVTSSNYLGLYVESTRLVFVPDYPAGSGPGADAGLTSMCETRVGSDGQDLAGRLVCRDESGVMYGIAAQALYADLAEKYLLDAEYPKGTMVAVGGAAEATACTTDLTPFGIISTNPAFKMNGNLEGGEFIALKGRVPARVVGVIRRGQKLGPSSIPGVATANESNWIAIALDNYNSDDEGIIEAIVM